MRWKSALVIVSFVLGCQVDPAPEDPDVCEAINSGNANAGDACNQEGAQCSYGDDCGSCSFICTDGVWTNAGCSGCGDGDGDGDPTGTTGDSTETTGGTTAEGPPDTGDTGFPECYPDQTPCAMDCCDPGESCVDDVCTP